MKTLIVSTTDKRPFFDQVVDHGVNHNLLSLARRQELARQCNELHSSFCQKLGLNEWDIGETLKAARLVKQFLSIALERASGGEITLAISVLNSQRADQLVFGILTEIRKALTAITAIAQTAIYGTTRFGYGVLLSKIGPREGGRSGLLKFDLRTADFLSPIEVLSICQALKTHALMKTWLEDVADLESELEVSRRFLPWDWLIEQAGFKPTTPDVENDLGIIWTSETFIATMVVTLLCGGSSYLVSTTEGTKYMGTTFPSNFLDFLIRSLQNSGRFRQEAHESFFSYLNGSEKWPRRVETTYLLKVLGFENREKIPEKQLKTFLSYLEGGEGEPNKEEKEYLLERFNSTVNSNLQAEFSEHIRQSARRKFLSFLNGQARRPNKEERQCLNRMFEAAMDNLLRPRLDGTLPPKGELLAWAERIHLEVDIQYLWRHISGQKEFRPVGHQKSTAEKILIAIEEGKSRSSLSKLLAKLDWQKALNDNFADALIQKLDPEWILTKMPLMPELISRLCAHWETRIGKENWKEEHRVALVEKILQEATADFWKEGDQFFSALAQAHPNKRKELIEKCRESILARGKEFF